MASSVVGIARVCASCGKAEPEGVWFPKCARCVEFRLPSTLYCGPACQANHWPQHKVFHKKQKEKAKEEEEEWGKEERQQQQQQQSNLSVAEATRGARAAGANERHEQD